MDHDQGPVIPTSARAIGPYRAVGPFAESTLELVRLLYGQHNASWRMCHQHRFENRWIIDMLSADSHSYYALGPFDFNQHQIFEIRSWVTAISVPENGRLVGTGNHGVICLDRSISDDAFWVVCMPNASFPAPADPCALTGALTFRPDIATSPVNRRESGQAHDDSPSVEDSAEGGRDPSSSRKRSRTDDYSQPSENVDTRGGDGADGAEDGLLDYFLSSIERSAEGAANEDTILEDQNPALHYGSGVSEQGSQNVLDGQGEPAMIESSRKRARQTHGLAEDIATVPVEAYESGKAPAQADKYASVIILEDSDEDSDEESSEMEWSRTVDFAHPRNPAVIILEDSDEEGSEMERSQADDYIQPGNVGTIGGSDANGEAGGFQSMLLSSIDESAGRAANGDDSLDLQPGNGGSSTEVENVQNQDQPAVTTSTTKGARQPVAKNHGVKERQGGAKTTFVAYFRPSALPEFDKTFVTVGEFASEDDAWYAFNLFSTVHEGKPSYTKITCEMTKLKLDAEASRWSTFHRIDLLSHLRLMGRGKYSGEKSPSLRGVPKYRNVKSRWTKRGTKWDCDVMLPKGMTDPNLAKGMKKQRSFDSSHDAAKEADRLMYLREGMMAWTNFALTDDITKGEKGRLSKTWLPLQDNPKKYLTNDKFLGPFNTNNSSKQ